MVPLAVAVGLAVRDGPAWTVTSGLAVAVGVGLGASTHLVTFSPPAATLVVQKEPCANALGASTNMASKDNKVNIDSFLMNAPLPYPLAGDHQPKRDQHKTQGGPIKALSILAVCQYFTAGPRGQLQKTLGVWNLSSER
jgi:hypothetical protein